MNLRKGIGLLLCITLLLNMTACGKEESGKEEVKKETAKIRIGMTVDSKVLERWARDVEVFTAEAQKLGAEVEMLSANGDVQTQISQIDHFVEERVHAIVIIAADCFQLSDAVARASASQIRVVSYDRLIIDAPSDLYISFDNQLIGTLMAETMKAKLPEGGKILMICGPRSDQNALTVEKAFKEGIKDSKIEVIQTTYAKSWMGEYAFGTVNEAFMDVEQIDGVMCGNDGLAVQAIKALAERQLAGKVCVVGQDADVEACQKIVEGLQTMTVYKDITSVAKKAAEYTVMLAQDIPLKEVTEKTVTGSYTVPQYLMKPQSVDKENMDAVIIDSGFHKREDVYLNVVGDTGNIS